MTRTILTNTGLATMAAGVTVCLFAFTSSVGNKHFAAQTLAGVLLTASCVIPLTAASRCD
jgi:hypothetical protein